MTTRAESSCALLVDTAELVHRLAESAVRRLQQGKPESAAADMQAASAAAWAISGRCEDALAACRLAHAAVTPGYCPHCDKFGCEIRDDGTHAGCGRPVRP
jgi:hypothetical protein